MARVSHVPLTMLVEEIMTTRARTIEATGTIGEALQMLGDLQVRHLPVVREGELVGMVSDRDVRGFGLTPVLDEAGAERLRDRLAAGVTEVMSADPVTVEKTQDVREAIELMLGEHVGALPVVEPGRSDLVGIVSYVDVLRALEDFLPPS